MSSGASKLRHTPTAMSEQEPCSKRAKVDGGRPRRLLACHGGAHLSSAEKEALSSICRRLAVGGKGITACDESAGTIGKRFAAVGIDNTEEHRRMYRQMLFEAPGAGEFLAGAILDPETLAQLSTSDASSESSSSSSGRASGSERTFPRVLDALGIVPGVKPHLKVYATPPSPTPMCAGRCGRGKEEEDAWGAPWGVAS